MLNMFAYDATEHIDSIECIKKHSQSIWLGSKMVSYIHSRLRIFMKKKSYCFFYSNFEHTYHIIYVA